MFIVYFVHGKWNILTFISKMTIKNIVECNSKELGVLILTVEHNYICL